MLRPMSSIAHAFWPRWYRGLALVEPLFRPIWRSVGIGNVVELVVPGRRTGLPRRCLLGLLTVGERQYLGHPDGPNVWTRNVEAAGGGMLRFYDGVELPFRATKLERGAERDGAIRATFVQHPFPAGVFYWLTRRRLAEAGVFYRIELGVEPTAAPRESPA
jgi:hypothetical protein